MKAKALLVLVVGAAMLLAACNKGPVLDREELALTVGETAALTVSGADPSRVEWSSSDSGVATVDASGLVTAVGRGKL